MSSFFPIMKPNQNEIFLSEPQEMFWLYYGLRNSSKITQTARALNDFIRNSEEVRRLCMRRRGAKQGSKPQDGMFLSLGFRFLCAVVKESH